MNYFKHAGIVLFFFLIFTIKSASCKKKNCDTVPLWFLILSTVISAILFLLFLGVIKGLLGLICCAPVGMWGLGALIDLPRPLTCYQEEELVNIPVVYDQIGWPVHPVTGKRSVRALTMETEFCLNIIFFLAYPLTVLVILCGACCFKETCGCENENYKYINTIVFSKLDETEKGTKSACPKFGCSKKKAKYGDNDSCEERDTQYVLCQMRSSKQSLKELSKGDKK